LSAQAQENVGPDLALPIVNKASTLSKESSSFSTETAWFSSF
jgi:hypothetical protein